MSKSEDVHTLFRRFGGDADAYQEIVSNDHALAAEKHWPLLGQLKPVAHAEAPAARRMAAVGDRMAQVEVVIYKTVPQIVHVLADPPVAEHPAPPPFTVTTGADAVPETRQPIALPEVESSLPALAAASETRAEVAAPTELKRVFERLLPRAPGTAEPAAASAQKRVIKW